jgi:hypothetical protein
MKKNPVMKIHMPNVMLWWGPVKNVSGIKRRDLIILTHSMRGMPQKYIAEAMCLSFKTIERVLYVIRTDLIDIFSRETAHLDVPKTLREIGVELDILAFLMRKRDCFEQPPEYLLLAPLNP